MKRFFSIVLCMALVLSLTCIPAFAANTGSLSSSGTARAGETFTVTFTARGAVGSYSGTFSYDSSQVTLVSTANAGGSHWSSFSANGNKIYAQRDSGTTDVVSFNATFKVNSGVATGTNINIGFAGTIATSVSAEDSFSVSTSKVVEAPLSNDCNLSALTVSNATLSPAFNANTTSYSCGTVSFDIAKLGITATASGQGANVSVNGANLVVGQNTVSIVVTAASGDKKTYTISVEREQDPNYVPSNDTSLASIELSAGTLSPAFNTATKEYVVYLPYETTSITINGAAASELAKGVEGVEEAKLEIGVNELVLKVTAEDDTVGEYKIYVVRMDKFGGYDTLGLPASLINAEPADEPDTTATSGGITLEYWMIGAGAAGALLIGFLIGMLIFKKRKNKGDSEEPENPDDGGNTPSGDLQDEEIIANDANEKVEENPQPEESEVYEDISSNSVEDEPMQFEDIDTGRDNAEADVDEYAEAEVEEGAEESSVDDYIPQHAAPVAEPEPPAPVITFADLTGEKAEEPPVEEERPHVHYIAYEEYIDNLNDEK